MQGIIMFMWISLFQLKWVNRQHFRTKWISSAAKPLSWFFCTPTKRQNARYLSLSSCSASGQFSWLGRALPPEPDNLATSTRISNKAGSLLYEAEPPCEPHNRDLRQKQHSYYCVHVCPCLYRHYYFTSSSIVPQSYLSLVKKSKTICLVKYCKTYIYNHSSMQKCLYSACTQMWKIMHKNVLNINRHYFKYQNKQGQSSLNPCTAQ